MYQQNLQLTEVNQTLSLLRTIDVIVLEPGLSMRSVSQRIAEAIVGEYDTCAFAALYYRLTSSAESETLVAWAQQKSGEQVVVSPHPVADACRIGADSFHDAAQTFYVEYDVAPLYSLLGVTRHQLESLVSEFHIKEMYVVNLMNANGSAGTLLMGLRSKEDSGDKRLLGRIGEAVRIALDNKSLQEENQSILLKLQRSNEKLKMLDASKDEFISMASHQLRTPLTSVKGYLSMALEGDAGPVSDEQRRILEEAFASSQRMVYLIGDFLNVSRLQTGKFEL
jgi:signal transduction histidine kinase